MFATCMIYQYHNCQNFYLGFFVAYILKLDSDNYMFYCLFTMLLFFFFKFSLNGYIVFQAEFQCQTKDGSICVSTTSLQAKFLHISMLQILLVWSKGPMKARALAMLFSQISTLVMPCFMQFVSIFFPFLYVECVLILSILYWL